MSLDLDTVLEFDAAQELMERSSERMALLDERGRIAAVNGAWTRFADEQGADAATSGPGAWFLECSSQAIGCGEQNARAFAAALERVMERVAPVALHVFREQLADGTSLRFVGRAQRVRGALENWTLISFQGATRTSDEPTIIPEAGATLASGLTYDDVLAAMDGLRSHVALLDNDGTIRAVNEAWKHYAAANGGDARSTGAGVDYLATCERAARGGDLRAARFAEGLVEVLEGRRRTFWLDARSLVGGAAHLFRGRATRVETPEGAFVLVAHTDVTQVKSIRLAA